MKSCLVYKFMGDKDIELKLAEGDINSLDSLTAMYEDSEQLLNDEMFADRVGFFKYDNADIVDECEESELFICYKLDDIDIKILKSFISFDSSRNLYLPVIFRDNVSIFEDIDSFFDRQSFINKLFLKKIKNSEKKYLYFRIYNNYCREKNIKREKKII